MPCLFATYVFPSVCKNCQASHPYQLSLLRAYEHLSKIIATPWALAAHAATTALRAIKLKVKLFFGEYGLSYLRSVFLGALGLGCVNAQA